MKAWFARRGEKYVKGDIYSEDGNRKIVFQSDDHKVCFDLRLSDPTGLGIYQSDEIVICGYMPQPDTKSSERKFVMTCVSILFSKRAADKANEGT